MLFITAGKWVRKQRDGETQIQGECDVSVEARVKGWSSTAQVPCQSHRGDEAMLNLISASMQ